MSRQTGIYVFIKGAVLVELILDYLLAAQSCNIQIKDNGVWWSMIDGLEWFLYHKLSYN